MVYVVIAIVAALIISVILLINSIIMLNNRCNNALAQIDTQLKRRYDLIPNLVEVTKGYAKHESETLIKVIEKRNDNASINDKAKISKEVSDKVTSLIAKAEGYPELKANKIYEKLQVELVGTEDKIAFARQFYNDCVQLFNTKIEKFPNVIFAKMFKYEKKNYFEVEEKEKENVKVSL
jgi:Uncharacterized conserved protein